jgi:hypothetical protein
MFGSARILGDRAKVNVGIKNGTGLLKMAARLFSSPISQCDLFAGGGLNRWFIVDNNDGGYYAAYACEGDKDMKTLNRSDNFNRQSPDGYIGFSSFKESLTTSALKMPEAMVAGVLECGETLDIAMGKDFRSIYFVMLTRLTMLHGIPDVDARRILDHHNVSRTATYKKTMETVVEESVAKIISDYEGVKVPMSEAELSVIAAIDGSFDALSLERDAFQLGFEGDFTSTEYHLNEINQWILMQKEELRSSEKDFQFWKSKCNVGLETLISSKDKEMVEFDERVESVKLARLLTIKSIDGAEKALATLVDAGNSFEEVITRLKDKIQALRGEEFTATEAISKMEMEKKTMMASFDERIKVAESDHAVALGGANAAASRIETVKAAMQEMKKSLNDSLALL